MNKTSQKTLDAQLRIMNTEQLNEIAHLEIRALAEEGFDVSGLREVLREQDTQEQLIALYTKLLDAPRAREFAFVEPESLAEIRLSRGKGPRRVELKRDLADLYDQIYGGWLGRAAGCVLGKPVEPWGRKDTIVDYLKLADCYPLEDYFPRLEPFPAKFYLNPSAEGTYRGEIQGAPPDDDTDYTVLGLHLLETYGRGLKTADVAATWLNRLAYTRTYTAERASYRNLILGFPPEQAALVLNPEREYIGARIRADIYGLSCPGNPQLAAELAYQDAALSHTKNGIYSAMFMAACIAWAFVTDSVAKIIQVGLSEIPAECRLAADIREVIELHKTVDDWEKAFAQLLPRHALYHPVHAINNTVWLVLALLYGEGDFGKTIGIAVTCGFDTDCNGANAGAVIGVIEGARALPEKWTGPLQDTLYTAIADWRENRISALARRTALLAEKIATGANHAH